jgi:Glutathione S-transferase, N-terminal domain
MVSVRSSLAARRPPQHAEIIYRKVAIVLEELGLSYETIYLKFETAEHKAPEFTKYNPNGRIPAIIDHKNNDFVLWCASRSPSVEVSATCSPLLVGSRERS